MVVVLAAQVVHVCRAHERAADLLRDAHDALVGPVLGGQAIVLDLEEDALGAEDLEELVGVGARLRRPPVDEALAEARGQAAREGDDPVGVAGQQLQVHRRLAAVQALEEPGAGELDEVAVARVGLGQQREVVALLARRGVVAVVDQVDLAALDRLDPVLRAGLDQLDGAVHHAVVGQAQGGLAEGGGALRQRVDGARPVEQGVLRVDVQMGAGGGGHGNGNLAAGSDGPRDIPAPSGKPSREPGWPVLSPRSAGPAPGQTRRAGGRRRPDRR